MDHDDFNDDFPVQTCAETSPRQILISFHKEINASPCGNKTTYLDVDPG